MLFRSLKHNWRTLLLLLTLITTSQGVIGDDFYILGDLAGGDWTTGDKMDWYSDNTDSKTWRKYYIIEANQDKYFRTKQTWNGGYSEKTNNGTISCSAVNWGFGNYTGDNTACKFTCNHGGEFVFQLDNWNNINVWQQLYTLTGTFNNWSETDNVFGNGTTCTTSVALNASTTYYFKIRAVDGAYYSLNDNQMSRSSNSKTLYTNNNNSTIVSDVAGKYTFSWDISNKQVTVTYPTPKIKGSWDSWTEHNMTVSSATSITWTNTFSSAGKYEFVIMPTTGTGDYKNKNFTRSSNSQTLQQNTGSNATVEIDHPGSYTFTWDSTTGALTITYPTPSTPAALYIKGPLVNNGVWTDDYRQNWSSMTYNKTNNVYTFSFNASNACNDNCSNQSLHFCVSTGKNDNGKIHWAMNNTRTNWSFAGNTDGNNFVASSTLVNGASVPVVLTITYNTSTYKYDMALTAACTAPTVTTVSGASNVTSSAARLTGNISSVGDCGSPVVGIAYGTNSSPTTLAPYSGSLSTGDFTVDISGLTAGTIYYYRAYSKSSSSDDPVYDENVYSFYTNPSDLYIKGPLVYDSKWDPYTQDNVGYSHTAGTNTFVFSFNARTGGGGHSDYREYCVSTTDGEGGKIQSSMDGTTSGWSFKNGSGTNFVASSTIVSTDNTAIDITITYNNSTGKYHMVLAGACSGAPTINNGDIASKNWTKCGNENGRELSITASGGSGTLTYQWFRNTTNTLTDGVADLTGATAVTDMVEGGNTYSPSASDYGKFYYCCVVRSGGACSANKATSVYTGEIEIKQTPTVKPSTITVKQYEPVRLQATNSSVNWSITAYPGGAAADEYYLYDDTKSSAMFKGKTGSYTITATSTGSDCTSTSTITVNNDDSEGC